MKASELRIGNYVWLQSKQKEYQISSGHDIEEIDDAPLNFDAQPIILTEEWLEKLGFYVPKGCISYRKNQMFIYVGDTILSGPEGATYFNGLLILQTIPKYIHSLQNLYFALTGEELTIKQNQNK